MTNIGKIIKINPELENISGVSRSQADKYGKVQAAYNEYEGMNVSDYPAALKEVIDLIIEWTKPDSVYEITIP